MYTLLFRVSRKFPVLVCPKAVHVVQQLPNASQSVRRKGHVRNTEENAKETHELSQVQYWNQLRHLVDFGAQASVSRHALLV